jgi:hypothetical protein
MQASEQEDKSLKMQANLKKIVWKMIKEGMSKRFPEFAISDINGEAQGFKWKLKASDNLYFGIETWTRNPTKGDKFTVELYWNEEDKNPLCPPDMDRLEEYNRPKGGYNLQRLWRCKNGEDFVDLDPEYSHQLQNFDYEKANQILKETGIYPSAVKTDVDVLIARAPAMIEDVLDKLVEYGIPFFRQVAQAHGVDNLNL